MCVYLVNTREVTVVRSYSIGADTGTEQDREQNEKFEVRNFISPGWFRFSLSRSAFRLSTASLLLPSVPLFISLSLSLSPSLSFSLSLSLSLSLSPSVSSPLPIPPTLVTRLFHLRRRRRRRRRRRGHALSLSLTLPLFTPPPPRRRASSLEIHHPSLSPHGKLLRLRRIPVARFSFLSALSPFHFPAREISLVPTLRTIPRTFPSWKSIRSCAPRVLPSRVLSVQSRHLPRPRNISIFIYIFLCSYEWHIRRMKANRMTKIANGRAIRANGYQNSKQESIGQLNCYIVVVLINEYIAIIAINTIYRATL